MSELKQSRWAVISERGREASSLPYAEAAHLVKQLQSERIYGLSIITDEAAHRLDGVAPPPSQTASELPKTPAKKRATPHRRNYQQHGDA
ncbi:hypothetical protein BH18ACI2_BH18ACI2_15880 [soil metagenome]